MTNRSNKLVFVVALAAAVLAGVVIGVAGSGGLAALLARSSKSTEAKPTTRQLWTCSMHPQVIRDEPGLCPICHMQLTPLNAGAASGGATTRSAAGVSVHIDPVIVQNMG